EVLGHHARQIPVGQAVGPRHVVPRRDGAAGGRHVRPLHVAVAGALGDAHEPVHGPPARFRGLSLRPGAPMIHRPLSAAARLSCFSRYMALSASATRSSSRTLGSSSCRAMPTLTASWYGSGL